MWQHITGGVHYSAYLWQGFTHDKDIASLFLLQPILSLFFCWFAAPVLLLLLSVLLSLTVSLLLLCVYNRRALLFIVNAHFFATAYIMQTNLYFCRYFKFDLHTLAHCVCALLDWEGGIHHDWSSRVMQNREYSMYPCTIMIESMAWKSLISELFHLS